MSCKLGWVVLAGGCLVPQEEVAWFTPCTSDDDCGSQICVRFPDSNDPEALVCSDECAGEMPGLADCASDHGTADVSGYACTGAVTAEGGMATVCAPADIFLGGDSGL